MMQGVLARGTARAIADLSPYVAGKTGTSDDENDAWFVGFTNDVTVAVWIGYDNAGSKRRTLGGGSTGGGVAVPIFEPIIQAVWANVAVKTALAPPSPEAKRQLSCKSLDLESGELKERGGRVITECFRVDGKGKIIDTQTRLVSGDGAHAGRDRDDEDLARRRLVRVRVHHRNYARAPRPSGWPRETRQVAPQLGWQLQWGGGQWGHW
jgi:penicillin-binding protein 1A